MAGHQEQSLAKRLNVAAEVEAERSEHEKFRPAINTNSDRILEQSDKFAGKDFYERQVRTTASQK